MKKVLIGLVALAVVVLFGATSVEANTLPKTSWQVYYSFSDYLVVHETNNPNSPICWEGKAHVENDNGHLKKAYLGQCTIWN